MEAEILAKLNRGKELISHDEALELWDLIATTRHMMHRVRQQELRQYNVTPRQTAIMTIIKAIGDRATPAAITRRIFRKSHSVSEILTRMERRGLLRRVRDLERKNQVRVELTEKGNEAYSRALNRETMLRIMSALSAKEREQLRSTLQKLREAISRESGIEKDFLSFPLTH
jgi:DNA-binding MarR family transcriptional regulator